MSARKDGGPAFPRPASENTEGGTLHDGNYVVPEHDGMSLRDWFAGQALAGSTAADEAQAWSPLDHAMYAYRCADAMLNAREG